MNSKKILLVGDLRVASNFGAIATSTAVVKLIEDEVGVSNLSSLDRRHFFGRTPTKGLPPFTRSYEPIGLQSIEGKQSGFKKRAKGLFVRTLKRCGKWGAFTDLLDNIPEDWEGFERIGKRVAAGSFLPYEGEQLRWCSASVVNAEGSIVRNIHNPGGKYRLGARYMLFLAYLSKIVYDRPTAIVNHIIDPDDEKILDVIKRLYPLLDAVAVRDPISLENLRKLGITNAEYVPDALFSYSFSEQSKVAALDVIGSRRPLVSIGDSAATPYVKWDRRAFYLELFQRLRDLGYNLVMIDGNSNVSREIGAICREGSVPRITPLNTSFVQLADVLRESSVFFSGRWHASIIATMVGTPSVLYGTDSHKAAVLHEMVAAVGAFKPIESLPESIDEVVESIRSAVDQAATLRPSMLQRADLFAAQASRYQSILRDLIDKSSGRK